MSVRQLSVFLGNTPGRVAAVAKILAEEKVDISALVLSDTTDFGVLRLIVSEAEKAYKTLKENEFTVRLTDVIIVPISHETGSLSKVLEICRDNSVLLGEEVRVIRGKDVRVGKALDLSDEGQLIVQFENGSIENIFSGEVSVRGIEGYI